MRITAAIATVALAGCSFVHANEWHPKVARFDPAPSCDSYARPAFDGAVGAAFATAGGILFARATSVAHPESPFGMLDQGIYLIVGSEAVMFALPWIASSIFGASRARSCRGELVELRGVSASYRNVDPWSP